MVRLSKTKLSCGLILALLLLSASAALASSEWVRLADGELVELAHPGVDGVTHPASVAGFTVAPSYPAAARGLDRDSSVTLAVLVRADGSVAAVEVVEADDPGLGFERTATAAVRNWRFTPARAQRTPVNSYAFVKLEFLGPDSVTLPSRSANGERGLGLYHPFAGSVGGSMSLGGRGASYTASTQRLTTVSVPSQRPGTLYVAPYANGAPASCVKQAPVKSQGGR